MYLQADYEDTFSTHQTHIHASCTVYGPHQKEAEAEAKDIHSSAYNPSLCLCASSTSGVRPRKDYTWDVVGVAIGAARVGYLPYASRVRSTARFCTYTRLLPLLCQVSARQPSLYTHSNSSFRSAGSRDWCGAPVPLTHRRFCVHHPAGFCTYAYARTKTFCVSCASATSASPSQPSTNGAVYAFGFFARSGNFARALIMICICIRAFPPTPSRVLHVHVQ